jgi:membrane protein
MPFRIIVDAFDGFNRDDGWAIASHIALSVLMAVFPFLIVVTALAGIMGSVNLADEVARLILAAWPKQVAGSLANDIHDVLTTTRGGVLTLGVVFAVYFASSGIESLRIGLNRAYELTEGRAWWLLRLESIGYVLVGAIALLALAFLVVLGPLIFKAAVRYVPWIAPFAFSFEVVRIAVGAAVLAVPLFILHMWLPAGRRGLRKVWPGIVATLLLWLTCGFIFGHYLAQFAHSYVTYYAGLASAMIALVFLYYTAWIFIFGGELNAVIVRLREDATQITTRGFTRPIVFRISMLASVAAVIVLLREVLLPFVAGMGLAYLLHPLASRIERLGMNRLLATLIIIALIVIMIDRAFCTAIMSPHGYFRRLQCAHI